MIRERDICLSQNALSGHAPPEKASELSGATESLPERGLGVMPTPVPCCYLLREAERFRPLSTTCDDPKGRSEVPLLYPKR